MFLAIDQDLVACCCASASCSCCVQPQWHTSLRTTQTRRLTIYEQQCHTQDELYGQLRILEFDVLLAKSVDKTFAKLEAAFAHLATPTVLEGVGDEAEFFSQRLFCRHFRTLKNDIRLLSISSLFSSSRVLFIPR